MSDGRRFQADGAATEKELLESWRLNRGTIKYNISWKCYAAGFTRTVTYCQSQLFCNCTTSVELCVGNELKIEYNNVST